MARCEILLFNIVYDMVNIVNKLLIMLGITCLVLKLVIHSNKLSDEYRITHDEY